MPAVSHSSPPKNRNSQQPPLAATSSKPSTSRITKPKSAKIDSSSQGCQGSNNSSSRQQQQQQHSILLTPSSLKQLLTSSLQPVETIAHIQRESSWGRVAERLQQQHITTTTGGKHSHAKKSLFSTLKKLAQFERLLPILDVHKYSRASLFKKIYEELNSMLLSKLQENLNSHNYNIIIDDCLREHDNPLVSNILVFVLENYDNISPKHLEIISENTSLYNMCSIKLKQQIWLNSRQLFFKEITLLMNEAISKDQDFYRQLNIQNPFSKQCLLLYNLDSMCKSLASYVSGYPDLYETTVEMIIDSYEQSGQDSIYCLFLFSFNYSLVKDFSDENISSNLSYSILNLLNNPSSRDSSGSLTEDYLKDIVNIIDQLNTDDPKNLKLAYMIISSPHFIHILCSTLTKLYAVFLEESKLPKTCKNLQRIVYILTFCCQDLNLDDVIWSLKLPENQPHQIFSKLIPVLINYQLFSEKKLLSLVKVSNEVKILSKKSNVASFLVMHAFSSCIKKTFTQKSAANLNSSINNLLSFVKDFDEAILNVAPQHCLELMSTVFYLFKLKQDIAKSNSIILFQSLFFPWLKQANYPANFIMIKLMNCFKDVLDSKQWKLVKEIASELDHEEFCKLHGHHV